MYDGLFCNDGADCPSWATQATCFIRLWINLVFPDIDVYDVIKLKQCKNQVKF